MISLGINYSQYHDSAACIARDGEVLFAIAEERLSRVKQDASFPLRAIGACLDFANVKPEELDFVCHGWPEAGRALRHDLKSFALGRQPLDSRVLMSSVRSFASMWSAAERRDHLPASLSRTQGRVQVPRPSPGARHQRVRVLGVRRRGDLGPGRSGWVGGVLDLGWARLAGSSLSRPSPGPIPWGSSTRSSPSSSVSSLTRTSGR